MAIIAEIGYWFTQFFEDLHEATNLVAHEVGSIASSVGVTRPFE